MRGHFDKWTGTIDINEQKPEATKVEVKIEAASINTRQPDRDAHLRSPDFLNAEDYPYITFRSKQVKQTDKNHAQLIGDLTIRGVTREVTLEVTYQGQARSPFGPFMSAGFSAETKLNRKNWNLNWNAALETGGVLVGDEISVSVELELTSSIEEKEAAEATVA